MVTIHTIKNSPAVRPLIEHLEKAGFEVSKSETGKFEVKTVGLKKVAEAIQDHLNRQPKEMLISNEPSVGYTVFAAIDYDKGWSYILSNDKGHKKLSKKEGKQAKLALV